MDRDLTARVASVMSPVKIPNNPNSTPQKARKLAFSLGVKLREATMRTKYPQAAATREDKPTNDRLFPLRDVAGDTASPPPRVSDRLKPASCKVSTRDWTGSAAGTRHECVFRVIHQTRRQLLGCRYQCISCHLWAWVLCGIFGESFR